MEVRDVIGIGLMLGSAIGSMQAGHRKSNKVLSGKQKNGLRKEMKLFMDEHMDTAAILKEIKYEGMEL